MLAGLALVVTAVVGFVLPFLTLDPHSLTTRPYYWDLARQQLSTSPVYGFGAKAWEGLYAAGQIPVALSHSLQNQWMDLMYAGGIVALAVFIFLVGYVLLRGGAGNFLVAACLIVPVLAASTLERPWSFGINDSLTFTLVAATLIPVARRREPSAGPPATAQEPPLASLSRRANVGSRSARHRDLLPVGVQMAAGSIEHAVEGAEGLVPCEPASLLVGLVADSLPLRLVGEGGDDSGEGALVVGD